MQNLKGSFLVSTPALNDTFFERSVIFITEHNNEGAYGFILNHPFPRKLNELLEFKHAAAIDLYNGGPVANEQLFFLHSSDINIPGGKSINDNIYQGGDFRKAVELLSNGKLSLAEIKIFIGYCGWNSNELESEIAEGSWKILPASTETIFNHAEEIIWNEWINLQ